MQSPFARRGQFTLWLLPLLSLLVAGAGEAAVLTLGASSDNTMCADNGALSNGSGNYFFTGATDNGSARRALLRFDLSSIPAGSTINSVSLRLYCSRAKQNTSYSISLHRVLADWGEGTSHASGEEGQGATAMTNDATWTHRLYPTTTWANPGGDHVSGASASTGVGPNGQYFTWTAAGMVADVQSWLDGNSPNFGWLLIGQEGQGRTAKRFDSRQGLDAARRPALTIDYTAGGAPTGACCLPSDCIELSSAECASQGGAYQGDGSSCEPDPCSGAPVTVTLGSRRDNTLYEIAAGDLSNAAGQRFIAGKNQNGLRRRGVVAFDVDSSVPSGAVVQSVSLTLRLALGGGSTGNQNVALHRTLADWGEGTSVAGGDESNGAPATASDATWRHTFYPSAFWPTPGGQWLSTASSSLSVSSEAFYAWSSATMVSDVQGWLDSPSSNFGWTVIGKETGGGNTQKPFHTKEATDPAFRPVLSITYVYTPPPPSGACCLDDGTCSELTEAECMAVGGTYRGDDTACMPDLCPVELTPFVDPLPIPAVAIPTAGEIGHVATYDIEIREVTQQLHRDLPPTRVWGYDGSYPGPTIVAFRDEPVTVNWISDLRDSTGALRTTHYLPVDECLHGPDTFGQSPRTVVHLHGGHVPPESDGYPEATMLPGEQLSYIYPNNQEASTLWYHDHALGITRLNVMMGLAGFYLLRDSVEVALNLPSGPYEIGLAIQDRSFHADGSLMYPAMWEEHFFGDKVLVNGKVWPYLNVKQGKYRFRILEGSNARTYRLALSNGASFTVIGTDGGLLEAPVTRNVLTISPGERMDVVVDFAPFAPGTEILLLNDAPAPFPGLPNVGVVPNVMKFVVTPGAGHTAPLPSTLRPLIERLDPAQALEDRQFILRKSSDPCAGSMWMINDLMWDDITEYPVLGTTETWTFVNPTGVVHPMHMHLVMFQVLDRTPITMVGNEVVATGPPVPPDASEAGWKDTAVAHPNEALRVICRFEDYAGLYAYHCHILEHEDNEMMRQFQTVEPNSDVMPSPVKHSFAFEPNQPNPFQSMTNLIFELPQADRTVARIYDLRGRLIRELVDGPRPSGRQSLAWDGLNEGGRPVPGGVYFVHLESGEYRAVRKVTVLR
jgi:FtsP/CotA-like multicopper oxidase with cupredoxin domain